VGIVTVWVRRDPWLRFGTKIKHNMLRSRGSWGFFCEASGKCCRRNFGGALQRALAYDWVGCLVGRLGKAEVFMGMEWRTSLHVTHTSLHISITYLFFTTVHLTSENYINQLSQKVDHLHPKTPSQCLDKPASRTRLSLMTAKKTEVLHNQHSQYNQITQWFDWKRW